MEEITEKSNHHQVIKAFEATFPHIRSMMLCKRDNVYTLKITQSIT
jgi:hypothetical protein